MRHLRTGKHGDFQKGKWEMPAERTSPILVAMIGVVYKHQSGGMTAGKNVLDQRIQVINRVQTALAVWEIQ